MTNFNMRPRRRIDLVKWIALILVALGLIALCVALIPNWGVTEKTFNVNLAAYKALTADDVKNGKTMTTTTQDGEVELFHLLLVSYDERTRECVFIMGILPEDADESGQIDDNEAGFLCFVKAFDFEEDEVAQLSTFRGFRWLSLEKEYVVAVNFMGQSYGKWANVSTLFFLLEGSDGNQIDVPMVKAPSAKLKFDAEGTVKPSDKVMTALTGGASA